MLNIYVTDLAAYNNGYLIGKWISLPVEEDELKQEINQVLVDGATTCGYNEVHEEYFITDYEWEEINIFEVDEFDNVFELNEKVKLLEDLTQSQVKGVRYLIDYGICTDIEDAISKCDDVVIFEDQSLEDVAYNLIHECYNIDDIPSIIYNNIDYKSIAQELDYSGEYQEVDNNVIQYVY